MYYTMSLKYRSIISRFYPSFIHNAGLIWLLLLVGKDAYIHHSSANMERISSHVYHCTLLFKVFRIHGMKSLLCSIYLHLKFLKTKKYKKTNTQIKKHQHTITSKTNTTSELTGSGRRSPEWHGVRGKWCAWKCFFMRLTTYKHKTEYLALLSNELSIYIFVRQWRKLITILS